MRLAVAVCCAFLIAAALGARGERAAAAESCPTTAAVISPSTQFKLPENAKPTAKFVAFEVEVDPAGRATGVHLADPSGDPAVDLAVRQIVQDAQYTPAQTGCVAYTGAAAVVLPLAPDAGRIIASPPPKLDPTCTPFVNVFLTPGPRDRKRTATAIVDVPLDASATRSGPPVLKHDTGSAALDAEAIRLATNGHYRFLEMSACTPQAFTYQLQMTFE